MLELSIGSYLVFDEFHLLDSQRSLSTLFHLLKILNGFSPFCLMTATLSDKLQKELSNEINAEVVSVSNEEVSFIPSQKNKIRRLKVENNFLTADAILKNHKNYTRTIVLCNTVEKCQNIFKI